MALSVTSFAAKTFYSMIFNLSSAILTALKVLLKNAYKSLNSFGFYFQSQEIQRQLKMGLSYHRAGRGGWDG